MIGATGYAGLHRQRSRLLGASGTGSLGSPSSTGKSLGGDQEQASGAPLGCEGGSHCEEGGSSNNPLDDVRQAVQLQLQQSARAEARTAALESKASMRVHHSGGIAKALPCSVMCTVGGMARP